MDIPATSHGSVEDAMIADIAVANSRQVRPGITSLSHMAK